MKKTKLAVIMLFLMFCGMVQAQEKAKAAEKRQSSVQVSFYKKGDQTKTARVKVTAKNENKKFFPAQNAEVSFYVQNDKEEKLISKTETGVDGKASVDLPKDLALNAEMKYTIIAKIENSKTLEDAEDQGSIKDANLTLTAKQGDTTRTVTVKATEIGKDGKEKPIADVTINFYVERMFGTMLAGEDHAITTDENGEGTFSLPRDVKGDTEGNITVVARIDDNDTYGTVESKLGAKFGIPLEVDKDPFPRALWEPRAPAPLVAILSVIFTCIWLTYFSMFYTMYKISQDKNVPTTGKPPFELTYEED